MTREILKAMKSDLENQIKIQTEEILNNPTLSDGRNGLLWKCGYVSALKQVTKQIETLLKGDAE